MFLTFSSTTLSQLSLCLCLYKPESLLYPMVKFRVCRGKGSRDIVKQIYPCDQNHEKWFISQAHSPISNGNVTLLYIYPYKLQSLLHPTVQVS